MMPDLKVMLFPDAKVGGQDCIVYSYNYSMQGMSFNIYHWFSKDKGFVILTETFTPEIPGMGDMFADMNLDDLPAEMREMYASMGVPSLSATYWYEIKKVDKNDAFYDPNQQGVTKWTEQ